MRRLEATLIVALIVGPCAPIAVEAEWLVLRDGTRLETRGVARVEGRRVLFTDAGGTLAALPAAEVDLAATEAANRTAAAPPAENAAPAASAAIAAPATRRPPVRRFTDADFDHLDDVDSPTIAFYTTSWCGWCRKSRELLDQLGVRYQEMDVEENAAADAEKERLAPGSGVPVIAFRDTVLTGYTERGIRRMADAWRVAEKEAEAARQASRRPASAKPAAE